jgi:Ca-activated chloride channel homolog
MSLLVPAALAFAFIIPLILLLYFMRPKRQERTIGSTFLWQQALQNLQASQPWQRLRMTPLLLLQLLAAAVLILVLARPAILTGSALGGNTIVILQASASMQATDVAPNRFESARSTLSDFIDELGAGDQLSLMTMARTPRVLIANSQDKNQLKAALRTAYVTNQDADLEQALSLALSLGASRANTQILIVGDGHVMNSQQVLISPLPVRYLQIGTDAPNAALLALAARPLQGKLYANAQIANYSKQSRSLPIELYADGRLVGVQTLALAPGVSGTVQWGPLAPETRMIHAHIVSQDPLSVDHDAWALVGSSQRGRVLLVTKSNVFLERGLRSLPNVNLYETTPDKYVNTGSYDLTIFDGYQPPTLPSGNLFFVNPPNGSGLFGSSGPTLHISQVSAGSTQSQLSLLLNTAVDVSSIHTIRASHQLQAASWLQTVLAAPETPLLLAGENDNRRVAVLGFDLHDSDLPLQSAWPILLYNLSSWFLPQPVSGNGQVLAGQPVTVQPWPGAEQVTVTGPDKQAVKVGPPFPVQPDAATDQVGLYQVTQSVRGQDLNGAFTVNLFNPTQSNLAPASQLPIAHSARFATGGNAVTHQFREIWPWIAAVLLLVLCAEWWLFSRPYQAQHVQSGQSSRLRLPPQSAPSQQSWLGRYQMLQKRLKKATRRFRSTLTKQFAKGKKRVNI